MKNSGIGLRMDVSSVDFDLTGDSPKCNFPGLAEEEWCFEEHTLPQNHVAAVAWHGDRPHYIVSLSILTYSISFNRTPSVRSPSRNFQSIRL